MRDPVTKRTPVSVKIKFKSTSLDHFVERYSADISEGGIFIRTPKPLAVGTALTFEFQLQDGSPLLSGSGNVVWVREDDSSKETVSPGMGVRFEELPEQSQAVLKSVLSKKAALSKKTESSSAIKPSEAEKSSTTSKSTKSETKPLFDTDIKEKKEEPLKDSAVENKPASLKVEANETAATPAKPQPERPKPSVTSGPKVEISSDVESEEISSDVESEDGRNDRLERILFNKEEDKSNDDLAASTNASPAHESPKESSSPIMAIVILLIIGGVAAATFYFFTSHKKQVAPVIKPDTMPVLQSMKFISDPPGATLFINGKDTGKITPAEISGLDRRTPFTVGFDLPGKKRITIKQPRPSSIPLEVKLLDAKRIVRIDSKPTALPLHIDGKKVGFTPFTLEELVNDKVYNILVFKEGDKQSPLKAQFSSKTIKWTRDGEDESYTLLLDFESEANKDALPKERVKTTDQKTSDLTPPKPAGTKKTEEKQKVKPAVAPTPPKKPSVPIKKKVIPKKKAAPKIKTEPKTVPKKKTEPKPAPRPVEKKEPAKKKPSGLKLPSFAS